MKKTIFEGIVNGVKFDNVKDYNDAITKAIATGEPIQASSNTKTVDELPNGAGQDISLFPGFAHCASLDSLDAEFIKTGLEIPEDKFGEAIIKLLNETIKPAIGAMNEAEARRYKQLVEGIISHIGKLSGEYEQYGKKLDERLTALSNEIEKLAENAQAAANENRIVQVTASLYNDINEAISDRLATFVEPTIPHPDIAGAVKQEFGCGHPDPCGAPGICGCSPDDYITKVRKLVQTIFG